MLFPSSCKSSGERGWGARGAVQASRATVMPGELQSPGIIQPQQPFLALVSSSVVLVVLVPFTSLD